MAIVCANSFLQELFLHLEKVMPMFMIRHCHSWHDFHLRAFLWSVFLAVEVLQIRFMFLVVEAMLVRCGYSVLWLGPEY